MLWKPFGESNGELSFRAVVLFELYLEVEPCESSCTVTHASQVVFVWVLELLQRVPACLVVLEVEGEALHLCQPRYGLLLAQIQTFQTECLILLL